MPEVGDTVRGNWDAATIYEIEGFESEGVAKITKWPHHAVDKGVAGVDSLTLVMKGGALAKRATPAPEPWRPKYAVGQEVEHVVMGGCRAIISEILPFGAYKVQGSVGHWDESGFKWVLPTPPAGHEWHRNDFTEAMLPPGTRPLCKGEMEHEGDEDAPTESPNDWKLCREPYVRVEAGDGYFTRTTRPAPTPAQAEPSNKSGDDWTCENCGYFNQGIRSKCRNLTCLKKRPDLREAEPTAKTAGEAVYYSRCKRNGEKRDWSDMWNAVSDEMKRDMEVCAQAAIAFAQSSRTEEAGKVEMPSVEMLSNCYAMGHCMNMGAGEERHMAGISAVREACGQGYSSLVGELRRKLALAGVEGSPPPGRMGRIQELEQTIAVLRRENAIFRAVLGLKDSDKIPDQAPTFGSILVNRGSSRARVSPITDEIIKLESDLTATRESLRKVEGENKSLCSDKWILEQMRNELRHKLECREEVLKRATKELASLKASSGWVALSERKPLKEDGPIVFWRWDNGSVSACSWAEPFKVQPAYWMTSPPLPTPPPSPEEGERSIIVKHVHPPIPIRTHDYSAYRDGYEGGEPIGWGETKEAAIEDLKEQEDEARKPKGERP